MCGCLRHGLMNVPCTCKCEGHAHVRARQNRRIVTLDLGELPSPGDPARRTEWHHLIDMLRESAENFFVPTAAGLARRVAAQIEAQVGPKLPPKPDEPTGLGAVVKDVDDYLYVRASESSTHHWKVIDPAANKILAWHKWDEITAVRVLSEGVSDV